MDSIGDVLRRSTTITFDCYGTLVDWRAGLSESFCELFGPVAEQRMDELFAAYLRIEAQVEAERFRPYRQVLAITTRRLAQHFDLPLSSERDNPLSACEHAQAGLTGGLCPLAERLPDWPLFDDTHEALMRLKRRYRLGVLSNIDRDLFTRAERKNGLRFDFVVTAEDVGAYKPDRAHFARLLENHAPQDRVLHVAQSLFHDGLPAEQLSIAFVWINRYHDRNETSLVPLADYPDLKSLADAAGV